MTEQLKKKKIKITNNYIIAALDKNFVKTNLIAPIDIDEQTEEIIIALPENDNNALLLAQNIGRYFKKNIRTISDSIDALNAAIDDYYLNYFDDTADTNTSSAVISSDQTEAAEALEILSEIKKNDLLYTIEQQQAPVIKLVNTILARALRENATDIHIEPTDKRGIVRFRINGILYHKLNIPKEFLLAVAARIKILSNLDISETRLPQDGSFRVGFAGAQIDFRVSTVPINIGERIVLRVLDKSKNLLQLENLGFSPKALNLFKDQLLRPYGIILVTGPTGSGKTTTLYAALNEYRDGKKNIITIEDPIEYQITGISQMQVKPEIGLTFATGLRSILRQDPDVIMVGEIRDEETMNIAIQSALTGHIVLSTLHTNDSISAITRLKNMGLKDYLISSAVIGVIAQRLIRLLCPHCKKSADTIDFNALKKYLDKNQNYLNLNLYSPQGCQFCNFTGYHKRTAIFEILDIDAKIRELIINNSNADDIRKYCIESKQMQFLKDNAIALAISGETSASEIISILSADTEI